MPFGNKGQFDNHGWTNDEQEKNRLLNLPGYVILGNEPGANHLSAIIERSWSMDKSQDRVLFWFVRPDMKAERVYKNCEHYRDMFSKDGAEYQIWDARDPNLPIEINWEEWLWAQTFDDKKVSGVRDKFRGRNPEFKMLEISNSLINFVGNCISNDST